jgi:hypothetical protein
MATLTTAPEQHDSNTPIRATGRGALQAAIDTLDLEHWLFTLSDKDYQAAARGHRAAGTFVENSVRGSVNVESVGGHLLIQHYLEAHAEPGHVEMLSTRSRAYLFHLIPVAIQVRWVMTAEEDDGVAYFSCVVEVRMSRFLTILGHISALPYFLRRHVIEETIGFVKDIDGKLASANGSRAT